MPEIPARAEEQRPVESWLETQVELHRRGFSCGAIDGIRGPQTVAALRAFQRGSGIADTGELDAATGSRLLLGAPPLGSHTFTSEEITELQPLPATWAGKSAVSALPYASALEMAAERHRASPKFLRRINPETDWEHVVPGTTIRVPIVEQATIRGLATRLIINQSGHRLEALDELSRVIAHFPVSIARAVEKRVVGELRVTVLVENPNFTFDPAVFTESSEAREIGRKLVIPPGPNNPVGLAWIGLDLPGYGIHGTPEPENVGRTESHGCFRLANWDAVTLLRFAYVGMPVVVVP